MAATARALARLKQRGHALHQEFHLSASPSADLEVRRTGLLLSGNGYYQLEYFLLKKYSLSFLGYSAFPLGPPLCHTFFIRISVVPHIFHWDPFSLPPLQGRVLLRLPKPQRHVGGGQTGRRWVS